MTPGALLLELRAAGAVLRVVGGRLEAKHIPPALAPLARAHAAELRGLLAPPAPPVPAVDQAEQLPAAPPAPTPPGAPGLSSAPPRGPLDLAGAEHLPAGAPAPNVPPIANKGGPADRQGHPRPVIDPTEAPGAQLEAPRADRLPRRAPPGYPLRAAAGVDLERPAPPLASPEAVARAIDGTLGALPAALAPWQRFERSAWGRERNHCGTSPGNAAKQRPDCPSDAAQPLRESAEEARAEVLAYYRTRPGGPAAPGVDLEPVADRPAAPFEGPEHDQLAPVDGPEAPPKAPPRRLPPPWRWSDVVPMAPQAPRSDHSAPFPHPLDAAPSARAAPAAPAAPVEAPAAAPEGCATESREARAARHGLVILPSGAYVDADQADELPRPPALARFDVRTDPKTDPEEHRRQALRADVAAHMADWTPTRALRSPYGRPTAPEHAPRATFAGPRCLAGRPEHGDAGGHAALGAPPRGPDLSNRPLPTMQLCPGRRRSGGGVPGSRGPGGPELGERGAQAGQRGGPVAALASAPPATAGGASSAPHAAGRMRGDYRGERKPC